MSAMPGTGAAPTCGDAAGAAGATGATGAATAVETVACPQCTGADARERYRLTHGALVTCRACGLTYVNPRATRERLEAKLQAWAAQDVLDAERLRIAFEPATLDYFARFLARLERHRQLPGRRLLDIGCSTGALLTVARQRGWDAGGVEVGRASARYAREALGLPVHHGSLYDFAAPAASYDAVTLVEVIEHLAQPMDALRAVHRLLRPAGLLLVTTPNFDSLFRRLFGARWWVVNCEDEHIVLFNARTLAAMLDRCGFDVVERRIRGLDLVGMMRELRAMRRGAAADVPPAAATGPIDKAAPPAAAGSIAGAQPATAAGDGATPAEAAYYAGRAARTQLKRTLARGGLLAAARATLRGLDATFAWRASPTYAMGEQLVLIARRRSDRVTAA
jgi:2-polyprenyl-3-methyl-5-hydroxy-6-metoxy-1,4-benzoquinol methylase